MFLLLHAKGLKIFRGSNNSNFGIVQKYNNTGRCERTEIHLANPLPCVLVQLRYLTFTELQTQFIIEGQVIS
jgi:hypothetical protein